MKSWRLLCVGLGLIVPCEAGYKVVGDKVDICENKDQLTPPETEIEIETPRLARPPVDSQQLEPSVGETSGLDAPRSALPPFDVKLLDLKWDNPLAGNIPSKALNIGDDNLFRPPTPSPPPVSNRYIARVTYYYSLEGSLKVLNQLVYEKQLYLTNDGAFYYDQAPEDIEYRARPVIKTKVTEAVVTETVPQTLYSISQIWENDSDEPLHFTADPFTIHYTLWTKFHDGFTYIHDDDPVPVPIHVRSGEYEKELLWPFYSETTGPLPHQGTWTSRHMNLTVPPRSTYRLVREVAHDTLKGHVTMKALVGTDLGSDFKWQMRVCGSPSLDSARFSCKWVEKGDFLAKDVAKTLTEADKIRLCGSPHPRLCRLIFDQDGMLYALATSSFSVGLSPFMRTTILDVTNQTNIVEVEAHIQ